MLSTAFIPPELLSINTVTRYHEGVVASSPNLTPEHVRLVCQRMQNLPPVDADSALHQNIMEADSAPLPKANGEADSAPLPKANREAERGRGRGWPARAIAAWHQVARRFEGATLADAVTLIQSLEKVTRLSRPILRESWRNLFSQITEGKMQRWWREVSDERGSGEYPKLIGLFAPGNIPGVAVLPLVQLSLLGIPVIIKNASDEPFLVPLLLHELAQIDNVVAGRLVTLHWSRQDEAITEAFISSVARVVAFGHDETLENLRPVGSNAFDGFGDKLSVAIVNPNCVAQEDMHHLAYDIAMFDQKGCMSPQFVFLITNNWQTTEYFCKRLAQALAEIERRFPAGHWRDSDSAAVQQWRGAMEARQAEGEQVTYLRSSKLSWTVAGANSFDLHERVALRFARVWRMDNTAAVFRLLASVSGSLQAVSLLLEEEEMQQAQELFAGAEDSSKVRFPETLLAAPGRLQKPMFNWMDLSPRWYELTRAVTKSPA